ncbi:MAG: TatD family hydrolase, partial [Armatimonadetes bacterium]|nr:TatD family hydrolase [Armatimonadota bacterium]
MFFDSHCHLTDARLFADLEDVLNRAESAQVTQILSIAVDLDDAQRILALCDQKRVFASAGVHPASALEWNDASGARLETLARNSSVVAIGECGLDTIYDDSHPEFPGATRARQAEVLEAQLDIAARLQLPVVIHNREADEDLLAILQNWRGKLSGGVFHCFSSSPTIARRVLDLGFHLGFTGIVTFKNARELQEVAALCPLERILIETDAPYLAPTPHRGKMNEPSFVPFVAA